MGIKTLNFQLKKIHHSITWVIPSTDELHSYPFLFEFSINFSHFYWSKCFHRPRTMPARWNIAHCIEQRISGMYTNMGADTGPLSWKRHPRIFFRFLAFLTVENSWKWVLGIFGESFEKLRSSLSSRTEIPFFYTGLKVLFLRILPIKMNQFAGVWPPRRY